MKLLLFLIFISQLCLAKDVTLYQEDIRAQELNLSGMIGFDGLDGKDGAELDCQNTIENGLAGEDGSDGEAGLPGDNLYIYTDETSLLSQLYIDQTGGLGGKAGLGGRGSYGCNGGFRGEDGIDGVDGEQGELGKVYVIPRDLEIPKVRNTRITTLGELHSSNIMIGQTMWNKIYGLQELLVPGSKVRPYYYTYAATKYYKISLNWSGNFEIENYFDTKIAFKLSGEKFELTSYRGALLDYNIKSSHNGFIVNISNIIGHYRIQNLDLKKLRGSGRSLELEIKEKNIRLGDINSEFVISLKQLNPSFASTDDIKFYKVPKKYIKYKNGSYFLSIGRMRIPESLKTKGSKLFITVTATRKYRGQTRAFGLDGVFKI